MNNSKEIEHLHKLLSLLSDDSTNIKDVYLEIERGIPFYLKNKESIPFQNILIRESLFLLFCDSLNYEDITIILHVLYLLHLPNELNNFLIDSDNNGGSIIVTNNTMSTA